MRAILRIAILCAASMAVGPGAFASEREALRETIAAGLPPGMWASLVPYAVPDVLLPALMLDTMRVDDSALRSRLLADRVVALSLGGFDPGNPLRRAALASPAELDHALSGILGIDLSRRSELQEKILLALGGHSERRGFDTGYGLRVAIPGRHLPGVPPPAAAGWNPFRKDPEQATGTVAGEVVTRPAFWWRGFGYVVGLATAADGSGGIECTGTAIAPRWVLTARHCADAYPAGSVGLCVPAIDTAQAPMPSCTKGPLLRLVGGRFSKVTPPSPFDLALIRTEAPLVLPTYPRIGLPGIGLEALSFVGYGATSWPLDADHAGPRPPFEVGFQRVQRRITASADSEIVFSTQVVEISAAAKFGFTCPGDSGGPVFAGWVQAGIEQQAQLIGVTSFGRRVANGCGNDGSAWFHWLTGPAVRDWICIATDRDVCP